MALETEGGKPCFLDYIFTNVDIEVPLDDIDSGLLFESRRRYIEHCLVYGIEKLLSRIKTVRVEGLMEMIYLYCSESLLDLYILKTIGSPYDHKLLDQTLALMISPAKAATDKHAHPQNDLADREQQLAQVLFSGMLFLNPNLVCQVDTAVFLRGLDRAVAAHAHKSIGTALDCLLASVLACIACTRASNQHTLESAMMLTECEQDDHLIAENSHRQLVHQQALFVKVKDILTSTAIENLTAVLKDQTADLPTRGKVTEICHLLRTYLWISLCLLPQKTKKSPVCDLIITRRDELLKTQDKFLATLSRNLGTKPAKALAKINTLSECHRWAEAHTPL